MWLLKSVILYLSLSLFTSLLFSAETIFTPEEQEWLDKHPVIKVSNEDDWAPFDFSINGQAEGYSVDIVKLIAKKIGLRVEFVNGYSWSELLEEFDKRHIDLMHVITSSKEREEKYLFSDSYMPWQLSYLIRTDEKRIHSTVDFEGKRIAVAKGWSTTQLLKKMFPKATIISYKNSLEILKALSKSEVDIGIDNIIAAKYGMVENFIFNVKYGGDIELNEGDRCFHFAAHKENAPLISIFNKGYKLLSVEEKLSLQKKWFADLKKASIEFTPVEQEYLKKKKVIKMCIDPNWMPYEMFDKHGKHIGMTADYFKIFQKSIGIPIEAVKTSTWTESMNIAKARGCDIYSLAMQTPERKKYMDFTTPYLSIPLVLATKLDVAFMDDLQYMTNKKIGITKGYAFNEIIRREYPNINVVDVENIHDGLQRVANGELFGFIGTLASIGYIFQTDFVGELKIAGKFDEKWELGVGVRNDEAPLLGIFEKLIKSLSAQQQQKILNKYIAIKYEERIDYSLLVKVLIIVFLLMSIGLYHNRQLARVNNKLELLQEKLKNQANRDPMTNLYNRRYFHDAAVNIVKVNKRDKKESAVMMLDIDNFKVINDTYGHATGDEVIKSISSLLELHTRESDLVARFGGEEFVVLLPNTDIAGSMKVASKLREKIEEERVVVGANKVSFTISIGVAKVLEDDQNIEAALKRADDALYEAKESGKNRVVIYSFSKK